jgi:type VI protein secretion system component Hcp
MRARRFTLALLVAVPVSLAAAVLLPSASWAALDVFVDIPDFGKCGGSLDQKFSGQIEVLSFAQDLTRTTNASGLLSGKTDFRSIKLIKHPDLCSNHFFLALLTGRHVGNLTASFRKAGGDASFVFAVITLTDFEITTMTLDANLGADFPAEVVTLGIEGKLEIQINTQKTDGSPGPSSKSCWDFQTSRAC